MPADWEAQRVWTDDDSSVQRARADRRLRSEPFQAVHAAGSEASHAAPRRGRAGPRRPPGALAVQGEVTARASAPSRATEFVCPAASRWSNARASDAGGARDDAHYRQLVELNWSNLD